MPTSSIWHRLISGFKESAPANTAMCFWEVDVHSHLVPGVDDGVKDPEQALTCLKQLVEWGIRKVITTPHISGDWYPNKPADLRQGLIDLQILIDQNELPLTIELAAEYLVDDFFFDLLQKEELLSFGPRKYLLIETGWAWAPAQIDDILFRIQTHGYTPVLAHPERYKYFHENRKGLLHLREIGCLFQLNWMSLIGRYGVECQKQARFLVNQKVIDFIGSDLHQPKDLKDMARLLYSNELQLLQNQPLLNNTLF
ncbi:tyrosine-protein phosphatase [Spirosoma panaciterrae]|uniref:tyrosine-protein phosphatase n=1 Tax=Spirosoma panaciterrae TaxID=496058 RepID=UPI000475EE2E|nr:CpsB/CapC family capsule biosynthesis tyrosine phosphatase [Spirosoma panaciterrae]